MAQAQTIDRERLERALRAAHNAGDTNAARRLARELRGSPQQSAAPAQAAAQGPNTARFGRAPGEDAIPRGGFTAPTLPDSYEIGGGADYQRELAESRAAEARQEYGSTPYARAQRYGRGNLNPSPESVGRYANIHGLAAARGLVSLPGYLVDAGTGAINLAGDVAGTAGSVLEGNPRFTDAWQIENAAGGSQWSREMVERGARAVGVEPVAREDMTPQERLGSTATQLGVETVIPGAGIAGQGARAARASYSGAAPRPSVAGGLVDEMAAPYVSSPASTTAAEFGSVAGASIAVETLPSDSPFYALGVLAGGFGGALGSKLAFDGVGSSTRALLSNLPDASVAPRQFLQNERDVLSYFTIGQVDEAARRLRATTANPEQAAEEIGTQLARLESYGVSGGTSGVLSNDPSLISLERAALSRSEYSGTISRRYETISLGLAEAITNTALPENIKNGVGPDTFAGSRNFTRWAERQARNLEDVAAQGVTTAERQLNDAQALLEAVTTGARQVAIEGADDASIALQYSIVDDALLPLRAERNRLWNTARTSPEAAATPVDPTPFRVAIGQIEGRRADGLIGPDAVPSVLIADLRRLSSGEGGFTYQQVANIDSRIRQEITSARSAENFPLVDQLNTLLDQVSVVEARLVSSGSPVSGMIQAAIDFETNSYAPYFRRPTQTREGSRVGSDIAQAVRRGEMGPSAGGGRSGGDRFAESVLLRNRANLSAGQSAREIQRILSIAQSPEQGIDAAETFLLYSAARTLDPNGRINARRLENWQNRYASVLQAFPGATQRIRALLNDVSSAEESVAATRQELQNARIAMSATDRELAQGWFSLAVGNSPRVAFDRLINSGDPARFATDIRRAIADIGDEVEREAVLRSWQDGIVGYIDSTVLRSFQGEDMSSRLNLFNTLLYNRDNALDIAFAGNDEALDALRMTRDMLARVRRVRNAPAVDATPGFASQDASQYIESQAELPLRLMLGHLRGGGAMRSLRIGLSKIPGISNSPAVEQIIIQGMLNPEDMQSLLTRANVDRKTGSRLMTWLRTINQASMANQVSGETEEQQ